MNSSTPSSLLYTGPSMNPVFYQGDELFFEENPANIRKGDIILYNNPQRDQLIIHRIISFSGDGFQTAGDNNPDQDPYTLTLHQVKGRVIGFKRGGHYHQVNNGFSGLILHYIHRIRRILLMSVSRRISPIYFTIARMYLLCRFTEPIISPKLVVVRIHQMILLQLFIGNRLIGMKCEDWDTWSIYPPWRLFIDDRDLPLDNHEVLLRAENN